MADILFKEESFKVIGACFEVHNDKGSGFVEPVYQECLELELDLQSIPFTAQHELKLNYKGRQLTQIYKPDWVQSRQGVICGVSLAVAGGFFV